VPRCGVENVLREPHLRLIKGVSGYQSCGGLVVTTCSRKVFPKLKQVNP